MGTAGLERSSHIVEGVCGLKSAPSQFNLNRWVCESGFRLKNFISLLLGFFFLNLLFILDSYRFG